MEKKKTLNPWRNVSDIPVKGNWPFDCGQSRTWSGTHTHHHHYKDEAHPDSCFHFLVFFFGCFFYFIFALTLSSGAP